MGWVDDRRAKHAADAAAAKAATNGEPPEPATRSTQGDETPPGDTGTAGDDPPGIDDPYIVAGVRRQLATLRAARPGTDRTRNTTLYVSAKALGQIEALDRKWLKGRLIDACEENGVWDDDGPRTCLGTIASGYRKADAEGPREIDEGYFDRIDDLVREVPLSAFDLEDPDAEPAPAAASTSTSNSATATAGLASVTPIAGKANTKAAGNRKARDLRARIFELEGDFWERDSLAYVRDAALIRMTPPWGVLAHCVARALVLVGPRVKLPALIGGHGSLNWFGVVAGPSGDGKTSAGAVAGDLVKGVDDKIRSIGSGEGIAAQYRPPGRNPNDHNELMFLCEEIDSLTAMRERTASTTTSVLCNAFMGDPLGHSYKNNVNIRPLVKHEYRLTLIVGAQPGRAGTLLDDVYSGTLQRFQWFPGFDPRVTRAKARPKQLLHPLAIPKPGHWTANNSILEVPEVVSEEILIAREANAQGLADALDGHMLFVREKFAFGLAVLDDRDEITEDDWRLAGLAIDVSNATREWVTFECRLAEDDMAARRGRPMGLAQHAAGEAKVEAGIKRDQRIAKWIVGKLKAGPMTEGALTRVAHGPDRAHVIDVLNKLEKAAQIERCKNTRGLWCWALPAKAP